MSTMRTEDVFTGNSPHFILCLANHSVSRGLKFTIFTTQLGNKSERERKSLGEVKGTWWSWSSNSLSQDLLWYFVYANTQARKKRPWKAALLHGLLCLALKGWGQRTVAYEERPAWLYCEICVVQLDNNRFRKAPSPSSGNRSHEWTFGRKAVQMTNKYQKLFSILGH